MVSPGGSRQKFPLVAANNAFTLDLYRVLLQPGEELFFSPFSVFTALATTYLGARDATAAEMRRVLHLPHESEAVAAPLQAFVSAITSPPPGMHAALRLANALWLDTTLRVYPEFLARLESTDWAHLFRVTLDDPEAARRQINAWISERTTGKIPALLQPPDLAPPVQLVITNVLHFLAEWETKFSKSRTTKAPFHLLAGGTQPVKMMEKKLRVPLLEAPSYQALALPYQGKAFDMTIVLPRDPAGLPALERALDGSLLAELEAGLAGPSTTVIVQLPRFKLRHRLKLAPVLRGLGMETATTRDLANFGGIAPPPDFYIAGVIHAAFVSVNETGTEAGAATAIVMPPGAAPGPAPPRFVADRPFLCLVRHAPTGCIVFCGHVLHPGLVSDGGDTSEATSPETLPAPGTTRPGGGPNDAPSPEDKAKRPFLL